MVLHRTGLLSENSEPLQLTDIPKPTPGAGQVLIRVKACGVCHTELDEIEGRTAPPSLPIVPGHEIVGIVTETGSGASKFEIGARVGVGWIYSSDGSDDENLSSEFVATGRDVNGGYAEYLAVDQHYAYAVPVRLSDAQAAPLLCAGAVGYRALSLTGLADGQLLGLTGFGGSGHLVLQLVTHLYPASQVYVFARSPKERAFALELGAAWSGGTDDLPPQPLDAIIDTTPAWKPVLAALRCLKPGGRLVINAIRKRDDDKQLMADIVYQDHLWLEKEIKTVANVTSRDIEAFLRLAAEMQMQPEIETYPLAQANRALVELRAGHLRGAKVLLMDDDTRAE